MVGFNELANNKHDDTDCDSEETPEKENLAELLMDYIKANYKHKKQIEVIVRCACNYYSNTCVPLWNWRNEYNLLTKESFSEIYTKYQKKNDPEYKTYSFDKLYEMARKFDNNDTLKPLSTLKSSKTEKKNIHDEIFELFIDWVHHNHLIRIKDKTTVLQLTDKPYYGEIYTETHDELINKFVSSSLEVLELMSGSGIKAKRENLITFLKSQQFHPKFWIFETDWRYFGYSDGLYDIVNDIFITEQYPNILCRNYFNVPFHRMTEIPQEIDMVYKHQGWTDETIEFYLGMLGRAYFPVNELDKWGVFPINNGVTSTGKSLLIERVENSLSIGAVGSISTGDSRFSLHGKNNKELVIITEAENIHKGISEENFKHLPRGETIEIEGKGKDTYSVKWKTPLLLASNKPLQYKDNGGAVTSRVIYFMHHYKVTDDIKNTSLPSRLDELIPQLVPLFVRKYHKLLLTNKTSLKLTEQLTDWRDNESLNTSEFKMWLNSMSSELYEQIVYEENSYITPIELNKAWSKHWKFSLDRKEQTPAITTDDRAELMSMGITFKSINCCRYCEKKHIKGCCSNYTRDARKKLVKIMNAKIVPGGLQIKSRYDDDEPY